MDIMIAVTKWKQLILLWKYECGSMNMEVVSSMHVISLRVQKCYSSSAIPTHSAMPRPILKLLFL